MSLEIPLEDFKRVYLSWNGVPNSNKYVAGRNMASGEGAYHIFESKYTIATIDGGVIVYSTKFNRKGELDAMRLVEYSAPLMKIDHGKPEELYEDE